MYITDTTHYRRVTPKVMATIFFTKNVAMQEMEYMLESTSHVLVNYYLSGYTYMSPWYEACEPHIF
jgi:hypothetical protein